MTVSLQSHGVGPAVIFLHGVGSGKEGWDHQIDTVLQAGWRFVAIDAPGFGDTPLPSEIGFEPHVDAVLQAMDRLDLPSAVLCGHSMGGMTAQAVYASHPDRVDGMLLSATSPAFGKPDGDFQQAFLKARFEPFDQGMTMPEFAQAFAPRLVGPHPRDGAVEEIRSVLSTVSIEAYRLSMHTITTFDCRHNLPNIDIPTLLISGEHDTNSPSAMMEKMAGKIDGSEFVELPLTGHMAPIESPDQFNHHLSQFIQQVSRP